MSNRVAEKCLTQTRHIALWALASCLAHCSGLGLLVQAGFTGFLKYQGIILIVSSNFMEALLGLPLLLPITK